MSTNSAGLCLFELAELREILREASSPLARKFSIHESNSLTRETIDVTSDSLQSHPVVKAHSCVISVSDGTAGGFTDVRLYLFNILPLLWARKGSVLPSTARSPSCFSSALLKETHRIFGTFPASEKGGWVYHPRDCPQHAHESIVDRREKLHLR